MKRIGYLVCAALTLGVVSEVLASPPVQVGNSFFFKSTAASDGIRQEYVYYLAKDGTCEQLQFMNESEAEGMVPIYAPSHSGTYTYVQTPGNPLEATLSINGAGINNVFFLEFEGDTWGYSLLGPFSLFLASPNTSLTNVSNRVTLRPTDAAITGFVIEGSAPRLVLIRTVGPTLTQFGVSPVCGNPKLNLFSGSEAGQIASGQPWGSVTGYDAQAMSWIFAIAGAFQLKAGSTDVVYFGILAPGIYTAQAIDATTGDLGASALTEVYILPYSG
jgi:hypothetical protein